MAVKSDERYPSPRALSDDLERWLADEPVACQREAPLVRMGRFARKHKPLVATAAAVLLTSTVGLAAGLFFVNAEKNQTELARQRRQQKCRRRAAARSGDAGRIRICRWSMYKVADTYFDVGRRAEALALFEQTLALQKANLGRDHHDTLDSMHSLAHRYFDVGRRGEALALHEEILTLRRAQQGSDHPDTLGSMYCLAHSYFAVGRPAQALALHEETLTMQKAKLGPDHPDTLKSMWHVARSLVKLDRGAEAVPLIDDCLRRAEGQLVDPQLIPSVIDLRLRHFAKVKDAASCRETAQLWEKRNRTDANSLYDAACMRAVTAAVVKQDAKTPEADAERLVQEEADAAMTWLQQAVAAGYKNVEHMKKDTDLDALRGREDFKQLLAELEMKQAQPTREAKSST